MDPRSVAEIWMDRGAKVIPLLANNAPVGHLVPNGMKDASNLKGDLWWWEHDDTNGVGLVPGSIDMIVLDVDVKKGKQGDMNLLAVEDEHKDERIPMGTVVNTPSGGFHIYLRKPNNFDIVGNTRFCDGVDVRSDHGYVAVPIPEHNEYKLLKAWPGNSQVPLAPEWVMEHLHAIEVAERNDDPYSAPDARNETEWHAKVTEAFGIFEPRGDRHPTMVEAVIKLASYELLGYAGATRALGDLEVQYIQAVSDRSTPDEGRRDYRRSLDGARKRVLENKSTVLDSREADNAFIEAIVRENGGSEEDVEAIKEKVEKISTSPFTFKSARELMEMDLSVNWLIKDLLITPTYGQIAGEQKAGKTWMILLLAVAIASGKPFLGKYKVERPGPVVVFVGEGGPKPWVRRLEKVCKYYDVDPREIPLIASFDVAPIMSPAFQAATHDVIATHDPVLTVIDPFMAYHGGEVEAANLFAMGELLNMVSRPFVEHESTVLIANHFNKQQGKGLNRITMSGSGAWVDSWVLCAQADEPRLDTGEFYVDVEFGSRQFTGQELEIILQLGASDPFAGGSGPIPIGLT